MWEWNLGTLWPLQPHCIAAASALPQSARVTWSFPVLPDGFQQENGKASREIHKLLRHVLPIHAISAAPLCSCNANHLCIPCVLSLPHAISHTTLHTPAILCILHNLCSTSCASFLSMLHLYALPDSHCTSYAPPHSLPLSSIHLSTCWSWMCNFLLASLMHFSLQTSHKQNKWRSLRNVRKEGFLNFLAVYPGTQIGNPTRSWSHSTAFLPASFILFLCFSKEISLKWWPKGVHRLPSTL